MRNSNKIVGAGMILLAALALNGCETMSTALDSTGDVLSGDFRLLANAKPATLSEIWQDWKQNEVMAKDKWDQQAVVVPGIITRITKTGILAQTYGNPQNQIAVVFQDPTNAQCTGQGITRDDLMVNQKMIANLKTGDHVKVTGVLGTNASQFSSASGGSCAFTFQKAKIELDTTAN
ncbi:MAG TPA: hypothetical protein VN043_10445 [Rhodanobacter sp.]|nr:hypothetical protein [Rhodanobacter sp.]